MLLWINGPFGVGKTQTAFEIHRRAAGSIICDPEQVGFGLHRMMPRSLRGDFQELRAWRQGVYEVLDLTLAEHDGPVIAPMTLVNSYYFDQIIGRLRDRGREVCHVTLMAEAETVRGRISRRGLGLKADPFAVSRVDSSLDELRRDEFATHIDTDDLSIPQTADRIGEIAGLALEPNTDGLLRNAINQGLTTARHIRLGL
ncbi:AAA family ATPase [Williamsia sp.]|uniref:AAA family ATPase n=1 Tax=Williamsia sp. TaxID=1872085 RepID=UPI001A310835|nr:AAA family ATPase [Williamsia sp.]MBJ7290389.1 ATP-binding protein [Williamsia sp.]